MRNFVLCAYEVQSRTRPIFESKVKCTLNLLSRSMNADLIEDVRKAFEPLVEGGLLMKSGVGDEVERNIEAISTVQVIALPGLLLAQLFRLWPDGPCFLFSCS